MTCPECRRKIPKVEERGYGETYICDDCGIIIIRVKKIGKVR